MKFVSTRNPSARVDLATAVIRGLANDGGLFLPETFLPFTAEQIRELKGLSIEEIGFRVAERLLRDALPVSDLQTLIGRAMTFSAPLVELSQNEYICELFHGPTLAFKDFGARFLAQLMGYVVQKVGNEITVLVATSGDTGGAVAAGFHRTAGVKVVILYPHGRVSPLQEQQLTSFGDNILALEVLGSFDDCQALVKQAFQDSSLNGKYNLTSANSINIARLIPQSFYYFSSYAQLKDADSISVSVPSGNFGNLTAGIFARKLGLPIKQLVAGTNINDTVPKYLNSGIYCAKTSSHTISNAMDVGDPSNIERLRYLFDDNIETLRQQFDARAFTDIETRATMKEVYHTQGYVADPHTAIAIAAGRTLIPPLSTCPHIALATAHPVKFSEVVKETLGIVPEIPTAAQHLLSGQKHKVSIVATYQALKDQIQYFAS